MFYSHMKEICYILFQDVFVMWLHTICEKSIELFALIENHIWIWKLYSDKIETYMDFVDATAHVWLEILPLDDWTQLHSYIYQLNSLNDKL